MQMALLAVVQVLPVGLRTVPVGCVITGEADAAVGRVKATRASNPRQARDELLAHEILPFLDSQVGWALINQRVPRLLLLSQG